ncbi:hypothetical protein EGW08_005598, partial [Elysia chlorotica]
MVINIAVIGAGAVGLSAALAVQQKINNAKVTLIADRFDEKTTSWGAGGLFRLDLDSCPAEEQNTFRKWGTDSWKFYSSLATSEQAQKCGLTFVSGIMLHNAPKDLGYSLLSDLAYDFQKLDETQMKKLSIPLEY